MKKKVSAIAGVVAVLVIGLVIFHLFPRSFSFDAEKVSAVTVDILEPYGTYEITDKEEISYMMSVLNAISYSKARPSQGKGIYMWIRIDNKELNLCTDNRLKIGGLVYSISESDLLVLEECINGIIANK